MSRVITGNLRLNMQEIDLNAVVNAAVETIRPTAEAKHLHLAFVAGCCPNAMVLGDPDRLQQIAWNLLTNSIKFTPAGGRVEVQIGVEGAEVLLSVSDTGIGIEPDFLPHVFERFRQATSSESRNYGGLGIGLALVRHLVELHGGAVAASSDGGNQGARFVVRLPLRESSGLALAGARRCLTRWTCSRR